MAPLTCANCGHLFMQTNMEPDAPRYCNNCVRTQIKPPPAPPNPNEAISILIKLSREMQIEIEETCINLGKTFSEYFVFLHKRYGDYLPTVLKLSDFENLEICKPKNLEDFIKPEIEIHEVTPSPISDNYFKDEGAKTDMRNLCVGRKSESTTKPPFTSENKSLKKKK